MKPDISTTNQRRRLPVLLLAFLLLLQGTLRAQDDTTEVVSEEPVVEEEAAPKVKPVKNTFNSVWIIDNQTVMVPVKGTFEMDIMHRFGVIDKGYDDFWGFFAPSNIRLGFSYVPIKNLNVGLGITKSNMLWDANVKYAIITQTPTKYPVSVTYYGNVAWDTRKDEDESIFRYYTDRFSFFNQLIIARKVTDKFSVQVAPSHSHQNWVYGYYKPVDSVTKEIAKEMKHDHFAVALSARYQLTPVTAVLVNYDQPITRHDTNNPNPNISFGLEFSTSSHSFQVFMGNYFFLSPQRNNLFNHNSPFAYDDVNGNKVKGGKFLIGFNITRLWNY